MWKEEHDKLTTEFVSQDSARRLIISVVNINNVNELRVSLSLTPETSGHIMYFVKALHKPNVPQYILIFSFILFIFIF